MQIVEYSTQFQVNIPHGSMKNLFESCVKKIEGAGWDHKQRTWVLPLYQRNNLVNLYNWSKRKFPKAKVEYFKIDDVTPQEIDSIPELPELDQEVPLTHPDGFGFRPYQEQGVARGLELKRFLNGDEQGLGKTLQSIGTIHGAALNGEDVFPCLVICPASTKINWKREWEMWTDRKAMILDNKIKDTWQQFHAVGMADVFIVKIERTVLVKRIV